MKGIRPRGESYLVDVTVRGERKTVTCSTFDEAKAVHAMLRAQLLNGGDGSSPVKPQGWTLGEAVEKAREIAWDGRPGGVNAIRNAEQAVGFFGARTPLQEISPEWIDGYVSRLQQIGNSNATINRKLAALSKVFTLAVQRGKIVAKPHMERKAEGQGRIRFLTQGEETAALEVLSQLGKDEHAEAFCVLVDSGLRPGELWRLEGRDVNLTTGTMAIWETKNKQARSVPMTSRVKEILERRMGLYAVGPLFPYDNFWFGHVWDRMKSHLGFDNDEHFIPYALRHTCASRLVQRGVHLRVVQEWMGHKTLQITMRYAHLSPANLLEAVKVLEAC